MASSAIIDSAPVDGQEVYVQEGKTDVIGFDYHTANSELGALALAPTFASVEAERAYIKERLAAAIRLFAKEDLDHGGASGSRPLLVSKHRADTLCSCAVVRFSVYSLRISTQRRGFADPRCRSAK